MSGNTSGSIPAGAPGTGMVSPSVPFVAQDLTLAPLSFRFLTELWLNSGNYASRLTALEAKLGVTDGSNASAGQIGEYLQTSGTLASLTNAVATDVITLTLPAGDWDVAGEVLFGISASNVSLVMAWLSNAANTIEDPGRTMVTAVTGTAGALGGMAVLVGPVRWSIAAPATEVAHLGCQANFPTGTTVTATAWMRARRVR